MNKANERTNEVVLVNQLLGNKSKSISGQLVVKYVDFDTVKIGLYRKLHCGLPDIEFSVLDIDFSEILQLLTEVKEKIDSFWLTKIAST